MRSSYHSRKPDPASATRVLKLIDRFGSATETEAAAAADHSVLESLVASGILVMEIDPNAVGSSRRKYKRKNNG